ncbi:unnamed protein product [Gemmata massiliana]|uniref:Uncharacterized protein n=1 Tax=Gemmata massiliana TaxID=1210884 RepID=A0A6P2D8X3_9BACT|nr:unnamed protein product [Gemmata massiliana]
MLLKRTYDLKQVRIFDSDEASFYPSWEEVI